MRAKALRADMQSVALACLGPGSGSGTPGAERAGVVEHELAEELLDGAPVVARPGVAEPDGVLEVREPRLLPSGLGAASSAACAVLGRLTSWPPLQGSITITGTPCGSHLVDLPAAHAGTFPVLVANLQLHGLDLGMFGQNPFEQLGTDVIANAKVT